MSLVVTVTGTIDLVYPIVYDVTGSGSQNIILTNVSSTTSGVQIPSRLSCQLKPSITQNISFKLHDPITLRGTFSRETHNSLATIHSAYAPNGFVRYNGKVYR